MSFEYKGPGFYRLSNSGRAHVCEAPTNDGRLIGVILNGVRSYFCSWLPSGLAQAPNNQDLISEWKEPIEVKGWIPIYKDGPLIEPTKARAFENRTYGQDDGVEEAPFDAVYVTGIQGVEPDQEERT